MGRYSCKSRNHEFRNDDAGIPAATKAKSVDTSHVEPDIDFFEARGTPANGGSMGHSCHIFRLCRKSWPKDPRRSTLADDIHDIWHIVDVDVDVALREPTCRRVRDDSGTLTAKWRPDIHEDVM